MFDTALDTLDTTTLADEGAAVPLRLLNGQPALNVKKEPVELILYGADGENYRKASRVMARKRVERTQANNGGAIPDEQLDAANDDALDLIVACTKGWRGVLDAKGDQLKFTTDLAKEFYRRFPYAREQADAAIVDRTRFTKASSGA
jgi:hypothetical protein